MKERRIKALVNGKLVEKMVVYQNEKQVDCCIIHKDNDGREYYYPSNPNDENGLFTGRPKDAIECIRSGFGDVLETSKLFGFSMENVIRYVDRTYGEPLRQKTIDGWKDTAFSFAVKLSYRNSFSDGRLVLKNNTLMSIFDNTDNVMYFDSEEAAGSFISTVNETAKKYSDEYIALEQTGDKEAVKSFLDSMVSELNKGVKNIIYNIFMSNNNISRGRDDDICDLEVVQVVLQ